MAQQGKCVHESVRTRVCMPSTNVNASRADEGMPVCKPTFWSQRSEIFGLSCLVRTDELCVQVKDKASIYTIREDADNNLLSPHMQTCIYTDMNTMYIYPLPTYTHIPTNVNVFAYIHAYYKHTPSQHGSVLWGVDR